MKVNFKQAICAVVAAGLAVAATSASAAKMEKCYGIAKAGMNDCKTSMTSCKGSATSDGMSGAFLMVPKGMCNKIVGGSTTMSS